MHDLPTRLPSPPDAVLARLGRNALLIRSVWFATRDESERWAASGCPVYVRVLGPDRAEIGPRLGAMWAAVFSPAYELHLAPDGSGSVARWSRRLPATTRAVLAVWVAVLATWAAAMSAGIEERGLPFWAFLVLCSAMAPLVGGWFGGRALDAGVPWLSEVLAAEDDEEDW